MADPTLSSEVIGTWVALAGLAASYIKDKIDAGKALGRMEEKISSLENQLTKVDNLTQQIHQTNLNLARLEVKLDALTQLLSDGFNGGGNTKKPGN